uniref:Peptidase S1 domain-containing protein n=1 Tax=Pelusios castaneus TaxID=367368 RepID=A0A8C8VIZ9_9SAUR
MCVHTHGCMHILVCVRVNCEYMGRGWAVCLCVCVPEAGILCIHAAPAVQSPGGAVGGQRSASIPGSSFPAAAQCGFKLKGHPCHPHSQPWQAAVYKDSRYNCGATLINSNWVLTAAHCQTSPIHVRLGKHHLYTHEGTEQFKAVAKSIVHPSYNCTDHNNDIMLLKLHTPATLNRYVQPLGLATQCTEPGERCLVSGWGNAINAQGGDRNWRGTGTDCPQGSHVFHLGEGISG